MATKKRIKIIKKEKKSKAKISAKFKNPVLASFVVPGLPHPLLIPEKNVGYARIRDAYKKVSDRIEELSPDLIVIYSTYWASVIGHQIQADPSPEWTLVDDLFHHLGSIPYKLNIDSKFAASYCKTANSRGLQIRTVNYKGFPIDTGSVVTLKLLDAHKKIPAVIVSSNIYADRAETVVLGKAARETLIKDNKTCVAIAVTSLSNRVLDLDLDPKEDHIYSLKDQEWNKKILEFMQKGRLEDLAQLSRQIHKEARVQKVNNFKAFWWLSALQGQSNYYKGEVFAYEPIQGTGAVVTGFYPTKVASRDLEYDEDDPEVFKGERNVLGEVPKEFYEEA
jgi:2-aminophenol/2-amino-5-chlorophenol 1,6-dioxygenase alpha subunit